jgi:hypothetical protein
MSETNASVKQLASDSRRFHGVDIVTSDARERRRPCPSSVPTVQCS